jgi:ketosteroid isomerase-like protein
MERKAWIQQLGKTIDAKDADGFANFLTEDCVFRFGNQPEVKGREAVRDYVARFFDMIKASEHHIVNYWDTKSNIVWQGQVVYTRLDTKKVTVDFCNVFYMKAGLIDKYLIYIDNAPLLA